MAKADDALSLCGQLTAGEAKCDGYLAVAKGLLGAGDVRRAIDTTILATQALLEAPHTESLRMLRRESLLALARLGHLVPVRDLVALKIANDAPNRVDLALECYRSGHVATAIAELDDLARRWTGDGQRDPGSGVELVRALVEVGMGETALEVAASVERASASNNVWFYLAVEAGSRSFKRLALEALSRGCSREGAQDESESNIRGISDAVAAIGELLAKLGHCREAMELLKNAVDAFGMSTVHHHDAFALRRVLDAMDAEVWPASANEPTTEVATSTAEPPCQEDACGEVTPNTLPPDLADLMDPEFAAHLSDLNTKTGLLPAIQELQQDDSVNGAAFRVLHTAEYLVAAEEFASSIPDDTELTYCLLALAKVAIRVGLAEYAVRVAKTETEVSDDWDVRTDLFDFAVQHARYRVAEALAKDSEDGLHIATSQLLEGRISQDQAFGRWHAVEGEAGNLPPTASMAAFAFAVGKHEDAFAAVRALGYPSSAIRRLAGVAGRLAANERSPQAAIAVTEFCAEQPFLLPCALPGLIPFCPEDRDRILKSVSGA